MYRDYIMKWTYHQLRSTTENFLKCDLDLDQWASTTKQSLQPSQNNGKENKGKGKKNEPMEKIVREFAEEEFWYLNEGEHNINIQMLVQPLILILHSHRYKKNEQFTRGKDFSVIRDLLYCYSEEAKERFMSNPIFEFIYNHFIRQTK